MRFISEERIRKLHESEKQDFEAGGLPKNIHTLHKDNQIGNSVQESQFTAATKSNLCENSRKNNSDDKQETNVQNDEKTNSPRTISKQNIVYSETDKFVNHVSGNINVKNQIQNLQETCDQTAQSHDPCKVSHDQSSGAMTEETSSKDQDYQINQGTFQYFYHFS